MTVTEADNRNPIESTVAYEGAALVEVPRAGAARADVELLGGRTRWSVGGQIAEGVRWWRGELSFRRSPVALRTGMELTIELDNGRSADAVVERTFEETGASIRGLGPPPFDVP